MGVYGQHYDVAGKAVGDEFRVNPTTENRQWNNSVTALPGGGPMANFSSPGAERASLTSGVSSSSVLAHHPPATPLTWITTALSDCTGCLSVRQHGASTSGKSSATKSSSTSKPPEASNWTPSGIPNDMAADLIEIVGSAYGDDLTGNALDNRLDGGTGQAPSTVPPSPTSRTAPTASTCAPRARRPSGTSPSSRTAPTPQ